MRHLPDWVLLELSASEMRLLIAGLHRAHDGFAGDQHEIHTSSARFRDQLIQALLHCGYSAHADVLCARHEIGGSCNTVHHCDGISGKERRNCKPMVATVDAWRVSWTDVRHDRNATGKASCWPSLPRQQCVSRVPYSAARDGRRAWCVNVDHADHLIIAQRAQRNADGIVIQQSRPIVTGNCLQVNERSVPEQYFCELCLPNHPIHLHNDSVKKSAINKRIKGKGKSAKLAGLSSPQVESRKGVEGKKKDAKAVEGKAKEAVKGVGEKERPKTAGAVVGASTEVVKKKKTKRDEEGAVGGVGERRDSRDQQPAAKKARVDEASDNCNRQRQRG